jgi:hypothetical protein
MAEDAEVDTSKAWAITNVLNALTRFIAILLGWVEAVETTELQEITGVGAAACEKIFARVYRVMPRVTVTLPHAPEHLACMRRSGITSRSKWVNFPRDPASCRMLRARGPAMMVFWLSAVSFLFFAHDVFLSLVQEQKNYLRQSGNCESQALSTGSV